MGRKSFVIDTIFRRRFPESRNAITVISLVDKKLVRAVIAFNKPGVTNVNIQQSIAVDID